MLATAFLKDPAAHKTGPIVVLYGGEWFLKSEALKAVTQLVLGAEADDLAVVRLNGPASDLATVVDTLLTVSMWNPKQVVVVEDADRVVGRTRKQDSADPEEEGGGEEISFISRYREGLEKYLERPSRKSVLVLEVKSWPSNTRLAKKTTSIGLPLDCASLKLPDLLGWLGERSRTRHGKKLDRDSAQLLVELAGTDLGLLDQELGKLAAYAGKAPAISAESIEKLVGGWKTETTWKMLDAVRDGQLGNGLELLDKLVTAGEHPLKILGGINFVFRPIAKATELSRLGLPLADALTQSGVKPFAIRQVTDYLKRIGRPRAERIPGLLLQADLDLKGSSQLPDRAVIERLLVQLAGKA